MSENMAKQAPAIAPALLERLHRVVGDAGLISDPDALLPYLLEQRGTYHGATALCICPATAQEVSDVVTILYEAGVAIVPQGGNTGLCGGAVPAEHGREVLLNLRRLNRVRAIDPDNFTITVE